MSVHTTSALAHVVSTLLKSNLDSEKRIKKSQVLYITLVDLPLVVSRRCGRAARCGACERGEGAQLGDFVIGGQGINFTPHPTNVRENFWQTSYAINCHCNIYWNCSKSLHFLLLKSLLK